MPYIAVTHRNNENSIQGSTGEKIEEGSISKCVILPGNEGEGQTGEPWP
jgi:hypothetical protein